MSRRGRVFKILKAKPSPNEDKPFWKDVGVITLYENDDGTMGGDCFLHMFDGKFFVREDAGKWATRKPKAEP